MTRLDFYTDEELFDRIQLGRDSITLGRGRNCTVRLGDERVSRLHAMIRPRREGTGYELESWGLNGTRVNGHPVEGVVRLLPGDRIEIEGFLIVHRYLDEPTVTIERAPALRVRRA